MKLPEMNHCWDEDKTDAIASDWKAILGWVDKEGFSEERTLELTPE